MAEKPLVVISCDVGTKRRREVRDPTSMVTHDLTDGVQRAGGIPLLLPVGADVSVLETTPHALIISGSVWDVAPAFYGQQPHSRCGPVHALKCEWEQALLGRAMAIKLPMLAICGGMQMLNVFLGGSLYQDLSLMPGTTLAHEQATSHHSPSHEVQVAHSSLLASLVGDKICHVNSTHHQAVDALGEGLWVTARAGDNCIEAYEALSHPCVAVQWHPEYLAAESSPQQRIFDWLLQQATEHMRRT